MGVSRTYRQAAARRWLVGLDARPLFCGGPWRGGGRLEPSGSVDAYSLVDDLSCRWVHACIVVVPFLALREVAVPIWDQVRPLWVECGPFALIVSQSWTSEQRCLTS